jgi:hypothetical protein
VERIVRNRSATLYQTFYVDGVATDPTGTPTVAVTRLSDGTTVTTGSVTNEPPAGQWSVTIAATANTLLDTLTVTWTGVVSGVAQQYVDTVEVAGDTFFALAEARALSPLSDTVAYTTADITDTRTGVEQAIEQAAGVAFVPRYALERYTGDGSSSLMLRRPRPTSIRSASIAGTVLSAPQLADLNLYLNQTGEVWSTLLAWTWTWGRNNIVIGYEHGYPQPPVEIKRAALMLAKMWLTERRSPVDDRAITFNAGAEGGTYSLAVPGRNGSYFGHPDVDAAIDRYALRVGIA